MTASQMDEATLRLKELERQKVLPEETIRDLKNWWREKLRETSGAKIIQFDTRWRLTS